MNSKETLGTRKNSTISRKTNEEHVEQGTTQQFTEREREKRRRELSQSPFRDRGTYRTCHPPCTQPEFESYQGSGEEPPVRAAVSCLPLEASCTRILSSWTYCRCCRKGPHKQHGISTNMIINSKLTHALSRHSTA